MGPKLNPGTPSTGHPVNPAHHHDGAVWSCGASRRGQTIALALTLAYMLAEVIGGVALHSLARIADAVHMVADLVAIGLVLLAMWIAARPVSIIRTLGFQRTGILEALLNTLSLWLITAWMFVEAYPRFSEPPEVQGLLMLAVGVGGLVINLAVAWILHMSVKESSNVEGAAARAERPAGLDSRSDHQRVDRRIWLVLS